MIKENLAATEAFEDICYIAWSTIVFEPLLVYRTDMRM